MTGKPDDCKKRSIAALCNDLQSVEHMLRTVQIAIGKRGIDGLSLSVTKQAHNELGRTIDQLERQLNE